MLTYKKYYFFLVLGITVLLALVWVLPNTSTQASTLDLPAKDAAGEYLPPISTVHIGAECIPSNLKRVIPNTCLRLQPDVLAARTWADYTTVEYLPPISTGRIGSECIPSNLRRAIPNTCLRFQPDALAMR